MSEYMDWNDEIEQDSSEFEVVPEGEYDFEVIKFERGRTDSDAKYPNCNQAIITLHVTNSVYAGEITDRLILNKKLEWKLSQFFCSIGQKTKGEKVRMNWPAVPGAHGRCKITIRSYAKKTDKAGEQTGRSNNIQYLEAETAAPARRYTAGTF